MAKVDISGLSKSAVLAALYNNSLAFGMGVLHFESSDMLESEAREYIETCKKEQTTGDPILDFDYVKGRRLKVDLSGDSLDSRAYDLVLDPGLAGRVIENLRKTGSIGRIWATVPEERARVEAACFTFRDEANAIVAFAFRNGPIENLH